MALDGLVLASIVHELKDALIGGRIDKIYQIEKEDILLTLRNNGNAYRLLLTANSNYPRVHLTELAKNPSQDPPMFCMLLRKHIGGGRLLNIIQPELERILEFHIEATNELGDRETKKLIIEIMGRHSNIILTKEDGLILDSIKHISNDKSSVREILPNRMYQRPPDQGKLNPVGILEIDFIQKLMATDYPLFKALYMNFNGLSPMICHEICHQAGIADDASTLSISSHDYQKLYLSFNTLLSPLTTGDFTPTLYLSAEELPEDFYCLPISLYSTLESKTYTSMSALLDYYFFERSTRFNVAQKTADIKKLIHTFIERGVRKKAIQEKALEECTHKDLYKMYGELLTAYAHQVPSGAESFATLNYYTEPYEDIVIPLDPHKTAIQNAQGYFKLYSKAKRTELAATEQLLSIEEDLQYLASVLLSLDLLETKEDIAELRNELVEMGYLKKRTNVKKEKSSKKQLPYLHFKSSLGHDIYVGKNNFQNDELTMKFAKNNDLWLHIKDGPGSHVIVKHLDEHPIDEHVTLEAALLAAYHSSGKMSSHVPIDYTFRKNVKKVPNAKPGMVIYTQFKTLYVTPTEAAIKKLLP